MKIAINRCFGGFSLNDKAAELLKEKGVKVVFEGERYSDGSGPKTAKTHHLHNEDFDIESDNVYAWRADSRLIEVLEKLGPSNCQTRLSEISIVEVPDDVEWYIDDYDGIECVHEKHRSW